MDEFIEVVIAVLVSMLLAWPVKWCWNYGVVGTFPGVMAITWGQAWCLTFLAEMLVKSRTTFKASS